MLTSTTLIKPKFENNENELNKMDKLCCIHIIEYYYNERK